MYHVNHFQMDISVTSGTLTRLCDHHHYLVPEHFITPNRNPVPKKQSLVPHSSQPQGTTTPLSVSKDFPLWDIFIYMESHTM